MHRFVLCALALGSAAGCREAAAPVPGPAALVTRVEVEPGAVRPGEVARVRGVTRNAAGRAAELWSNCRVPVFHVLDPEGRRVGGIWCPIPEAERPRLAPGDSLVFDAGWRAEGWAGAAPERLPAGPYAVVGGLDLGGALQAPSAPVAVGVLPAAR